MSYRMSDTRSIKVCIYLLWMSSAFAAPPGDLTLDIIDLAAISRMTPQQLEQLAEGLAMQEIMRTKRSSAQAVSAVVSKASSGLQTKLGLLGQASAGIIAGASSKTSGGDEHHGYSYEPHDDKVDYWGLKKSILNTLFQAVKAITGGVTILKGQLIKGGGALAATLGKVISVKGDAVSNLGKKIVSSAALSPPKKHHSSSHVPVYGPPPPIHHEYPPTAYGPPTASAHFAHTAPTAHAVPSGFASHKYPAHFDGRGKLGGLHAGLILLTPLGHGAPAAEETAEVPVALSPGHTPLEPPQSFLSTAFSAIKGVFSPTPPIYDSTRAPAPVSAPDEDLHDHPAPPPPPPVPAFKPMSWGAALNSYVEPAVPGPYSDYHVHHSQPPFDIYAHSKSSPPKQHGNNLTPEKIQKIQKNVQKVLEMHKNSLQRSYEGLPRFEGLDLYKNILQKGGKIPFLPTPVVTDAEIGVLSAELQPVERSSTVTTTITNTTTTTTTTTERPKPRTTTIETSRRKKEVKYILRGNRIVEV